MERDGSSTAEEEDTQSLFGMSQAMPMSKDKKRSEKNVEKKAKRKKEASISDTESEVSESEFEEDEAHHSAGSCRSSSDQSGSESDSDAKNKRRNVASMMRKASSKETKKERGRSHKRESKDRSRTHRGQKRSPSEGRKENRLKKSKIDSPIGSAKQGENDCPTKNVSPKDKAKPSGKDKNEKAKESPNEDEAKPPQPSFADLAVDLDLFHSAPTNVQPMKIKLASNLLVTCKNMDHKEGKMINYDYAALTFQRKTGADKVFEFHIPLTIAPRLISALKAICRKNTKFFKPEGLEELDLL